MTILADSGCRVLYVEPNFPMYARRGHSGGKSELSYEKQPGLHILRPRGIWPLARFGFIRRANFRHYVRRVKRVAATLNLKKPILITYLPVIHANTAMADMLDQIDYSILVYDCVDEHAETEGYNYDFVKKVDYDLTARADVAFVTARGLYEDRKHLGDHIYLSPNGVDVAHFSKALLDHTRIPEDLARIPSPRIGFVGALSDWIDYDLMARIARTYPNYHLVLVGPLKKGVKPEVLENLPNVHFLGMKPLEILPGYLKGFDCGINPFCRRGIAERVNPLKMYEYLAAGLKVVSIDMPEVMPLEGIISIARTEDQFVTAVDDCITGKFQPDYDRLQQMLPEHDWKIIFDSLLTKVAQKILEREQ